MLFGFVAVLMLTATIPLATAEEEGDSKTIDRAEMRTRMLKRIDTDGDGKMSPQEIAAAREKNGNPTPISAKSTHHRLEMVTFPKEVQDIDSNMNRRALLYHPTKEVEGKMPLVILLHGAGGTKKGDIEGFQGNRDVVWTLTPANSKYVAKILVPHSRSHWNPEALNKAVDHLLSTNEDIDANRIYCIGYSMGGLGTWNWARHSPERLAAIVPVAFIAHQENLDKLVELPVWAMVGTADRRRAGTIPAMEKALKELGSKVVRTTVFEGANHTATASMAWNQEGLLDWLFAQSKAK